MLLFFARKPKAVHLLENAYGKLAFQYAFPRRYRARARDRDGAERRRGAQHGGGKEARARDRDGVERRRGAQHGGGKEARARDRDGVERRRGAQHGGRMYSQK